ncbi:MULTISPECIES: hypothetical protein [Novosphingobium]|jgi:hypothetical protein|nr:MULTISPECIES: hypothetical protein [Novosphingobium]WJM27700.1 hypothetical protein QUC32_25410 [Novosphingobium resinovorum]
MARIVALAQVHRPVIGSEWLRPLIVGGCALALILARDALPF